MMTFRNFTSIALLGLASLTVAIAPASAVSCRGPNGRFIKCATSVALPAKAVAKRSAVATPAKPRAITQAAAPAPVKTNSVVRHTVAKTAVVHSKAGAKPVTTVAPKKS